MTDYTTFCESLRQTLTQMSDSMWRLGPDGQTLQVHETWPGQDAESGASWVISGATAYRQYQHGESVKQIAAMIVGIFDEQRRVQATDFPTLRDRLKITLTMPLSEPTLIQRPVLSSLVEALVLDFDQHVRYVQVSDAAAWHQSETALWDIAEQNMAPPPVLPQRLPLADGATLALYTGDFAAICAWRQAVTEATALCAVPAKEAAAVLTGFTHWPTALQGLDFFVQRVLADQPLHALLSQMVLFDHGAPRPIAML